MLVVVSGLPGTGKTTVADVLASRVGAVRVSVDPIEDALLASGLPASWETGVAAYLAAAAVAESNLAGGLAVVADAVNDSQAARGTWRSAAARAGADVLFAVLGLDDPAEHRRRLEHRGSAWRHLGVVTWEDVLRRAAAYEPWSGQDHLVLDAARPVEELVGRVLRQAR